jgi:hypothetical protein
MKTVELLQSFVNQKPGLEFENYGSVSSYRSEMREITNDRKDFYELLNVCLMTIENFDEKLSNQLTNNSGRLTLKDDQLEYCVGQYFPTEYRPAANRMLANLIWDNTRELYADQLNDKMTLRQFINKKYKTQLSRRVLKNYFN